MMRYLTPIREVDVRTTVVLDDEVLAAAQELTGVAEKSALVKLALKRLVEGEAARRLALLGGSDPDASAAPRRRQDAA